MSASTRDEKRLENAAGNRHRNLEQHASECGTCRESVDLNRARTEEQRADGVEWAGGHAEVDSKGDERAGRGRRGQYARDEPWDNPVASHGTKANQPSMPPQVPVRDDAMILADACAAGNLPGRRI